MLLESCIVEQHTMPVAARDACAGQRSTEVCLQDCLALGAIFAATDSVAVLQVLKQDRNPLLYSLVFGEGVINDATAVALLRAVQVCCTSLCFSMRAEAACP